MDHPVFGLRAGMPKTAVRDLLGPPSRSTTGKDALPDREFWRYDGSVPDHDVNVAFAGDVIDTVEVARTITDDTPAVDKDRPRRVLIAGDGIHAATPGHAYVALNTTLRRTPVVDPAQLDAQWQDLRRSWTAAVRSVDTVLVVSKLLLDDLTGDATLPGHREFLLTPMPERACVQLVSIRERPGQPAGRGIAYRAWRTDGGQRWALIRSAPRSSGPDTSR